MRARSRSPATSSPHHEYTGGSIIQGTPVTRREQTASGRAAGHHQHDRISEKGKNLGEKVSKIILVPNTSSISSISASSSYNSYSIRSTITYRSSSTGHNT